MPRLGQPEKLLAVSRDVTERQLAEQKFRIIFEQSGDAHLLFSRNTIVDCNARRGRDAGLCQQGGVAGRADVLAFAGTPADGSLSQERAAEIRRILKERGRYGREWNLRRKTGEEITVGISMTMVELLGQSVQLAVWHDLTDRKETEAALRGKRGTIPGLHEPQSRGGFHQR